MTRRVFRARYKTVIDSEMREKNRQPSRKLEADFCNGVGNSALKHFKRVSQRGFFLFAVLSRPRKSESREKKHERNKRKQETAYSRRASSQTILLHRYSGRVLHISSASKLIAGVNHDCRGAIRTAFYTPVIFEPAGERIIAWFILIIFIRFIFTVCE